MFGGASTLGEKGDAPEMKVQSLVKLSGVGDDLVVGTPATVVASGDFVGLDFDRLATNNERRYVPRVPATPQVERQWASLLQRAVARRYQLLHAAFLLAASWRPLVPAEATRHRRPHGPHAPGPNNFRNDVIELN